MKSVPKEREILLDEKVSEQEFVGIIKGIYNRDIYIYAIVPEWEKYLLNKMANDFILVNKIPFPLTRIFPRTIGFFGYVQDNKKQYIYMNFI